MTQEELYSLLKTLDIPLTHLQFTDEPQSPAPTPPFIAYFFEDSDNFGADDKVYKEINNFVVELYTNKKDKQKENAIQTLFNENDIFWNKTQIYIDKAEMYEVRYAIQI